MCEVIQKLNWKSQSPKCLSVDCSIASVELKQSVRKRWGFYVGHRHLMNICMRVCVCVSFELCLRKWVSAMAKKQTHWRTTVVLFCVSLFAISFAHMRTNKQAGTHTHTPNVKRIGTKQIPHKCMVYFPKPHRHGRFCKCMQRASMESYRVMLILRYSLIHTENEAADRNKDDVTIVYALHTDNIINCRPLGVHELIACTNIAGYFPIRFKRFKDNFYVHRWNAVAAASFGNFPNAVTAAYSR